MNVCVYELGSMSGARNISSRISHYRNHQIFFRFYKKARRIFKCNIQRKCTHCVFVSENDCAVVASSGDDFSIIHIHAPAFIMMR